MKVSSTLLMVALAALGSTTCWSWPVIMTASLLLLLLRVKQIRRKSFIIMKTLRRDLGAAWMLSQLTIRAKLDAFDNLTVPKMFSMTARRHRDKVMFHFESATWTFGQVEDLSNRCANYFLSRGLRKGDNVAVFMENRPEYVAVWLGLSKIGVASALINHNLREDSLVRSVQTVTCKAIIFDLELMRAVRDVRNSLEGPNFSFYCLPNSEAAPSADLDATFIDLAAALSQESSPRAVPQAVQDSISYQDTLLYIYTSGTTGMPKASVIKHSRFLYACGGLTTVIGVRFDDIVYVPLPLYHSVAGMISLGAAMRTGITLVLKRKFSASSYWPDCVRYKVTAAQYIGEVCRYLLNTPPCPEEQLHSVRLMFGNGLRPQIWRKFVQRFRVDQIAEFYGSTEGNSQIINKENMVGAVGFIPVLMSSFLPLSLIKVREEEGREVRGEDGLCIRCQPGEAGEFVGKIERMHPGRDFHGYVGVEATEKKILRDVFRRGDLYFRSGDLFVMDELGWLYFKDRCGDTFRWKGENVSTTEVEAVIAKAVGLTDVVVYGVEVPHAEGRAGMAAIYWRHSEDDTAEVVRAIADVVTRHLPSYARPLFLRLVTSELEVTGTFKLKKFSLQKEGFSISNGLDKVFYFSAKDQDYRELTEEVSKAIADGVTRL